MRCRAPSLVLAVVLLPVVPAAVNADSHKAGFRVAALVADREPTGGLSASGEWTPGAQPHQHSVSIGSALDAKGGDVRPYPTLHWSAAGEVAYRFIGKDTASNELTFMAGPRYTLPAKKANGYTKQAFFFQVLFGGSTAKENLKSTTRFSFAPGVGWDFLTHAGGKTAFRVQVDRVIIPKGSDVVSPEGARPPYWRFSAGLVYRIPND
jgi:hypothetical protein